MQFCQIIFCLLTFLSPMKLYDSENIKIKGEYETHEYIISYGSIVNENVDGFLVITDINTNEEILRIIYDDLGFESFSFVADIGNEEIIIVCDKYYFSDNFEMPLFKNVLLMKYNLKGEKISQIVLQEKPAYYNNHNNYLIITYKDNSTDFLNNDMEYVKEIQIEEEYIAEYSTQYQGIAYINGEIVDDIYIDYPGNYNISITKNQYVYSYSIKVNPLIIINGEIYNDVYTGSINVISKGRMEINGDSYVPGDTISNPGYYSLVIYGINDYIFQENITIIPSITYAIGDLTYDFMDGLIVYEAISLYSNGITVLVNDELYNSKLISDTGDYTLTIYGVNGMQYELLFSIYPKVTGIENTGIYEEIDFTVFGNATLNGETISGNTHLDIPGAYRLDLMMNESIYKSYNFTIIGDHLVEEEIEQNLFNYNYIFYAIIALGGILILRKK